VSRLIVNADDFGLTSGVNRAIVELYQQHVLTSATLMAQAPATEKAIELARGAPTLGVGCHVVLVDGDPVLQASALPTLADSRTGRFAPSLGRFVRRLLAGGIRAAEIENEAGAQIERLRSGGVRLTHVDTHKHTHMFPAVLRPVLRAARASGLRAVRNPFEPAWSVRATPSAPWLRRVEVNLLRQLETSFRRVVAEEGFVTTHGALGVLATGTLDAITVSSLLRAAPEGTWEMVTHPGYSDEELAQVRTRLVASRDRERAALETLRSAQSVQLISFADL
jgi:hopanoid biosynthesis associated protein HpnK